MNVFDTIIAQSAALCAPFSQRRWDYRPDFAAREGEANQLILRRDAAFELGEGSYPCVSLTALTEQAALVPDDRIVVCGGELAQLSGDCAFARITLIRTDDGPETSEQGMFNLIRDLELKKFEIAPEGFMTRPSALSNREQVRVAKTALKAGLTFQRVGSLLIGKYRENKHVQAVWIVFVTQPDFPYARLDDLASQTVAITRALNHTLADLNMDCRVCEWKPVCDTVDGMKQLHQNRILQNEAEEEVT